MSQSGTVKAGKISKILTPVKRVIDPCVAIRIKADGSGVETAGVRMRMNPFDEIAVEAAVRLKENGAADEVIAVSCGAPACAETLRTALAMGADRAILIETDIEPGIALRPLATARLLEALCRRERPDLVICGKQAVDSDAGQTGAMLAALLGWPLAARVSRITGTSHIPSPNAVDAGPDLAAGRIDVTCETDDGREIWRLTYPAVLTAELGLNEPRYVTLPNLMKAKKKALETLTPEILRVDVGSRLETLSVAASPSRRACVRVADADALLARLRDEARVI